MRKFGHKIAEQFFLHLFAQIVTQLILRVFSRGFLWLFTVSLFRKSRRCALILFKHGMFLGVGLCPAKSHKNTTSKIITHRENLSPKVLKAYS